MLTRVGLRAAAVAACALVGCSAVRPAPVVQTQTLRFPPGALRKVAVVPFTHRDSMPANPAVAGPSPQVAAELVARFVTEAIAKRGIQVIPASDLATAFAAHGFARADLDPKTAAELAAKEFGATSIVMGQVSRYRERQGERFGSTGAASVAFNLTLYSAAPLQRIWSSQFDETQRALSENIVNARRYPGGGTRWLSAAELAQWGAESAIDDLPIQR